MGLIVNFCAGVNEDLLPAPNVEAILVNTPQDASSERLIRRANKMFLVARPSHIMLDSGGFQVLEMERKNAEITHDPSRPAMCKPGRVNIATKHIVEATWKIIPHPHIVTALDAPVLKMENPSLQDNEFRNKIGRNVKWMVEMCGMRKNLPPGTEIFLPIQCYDLAQFSFYEPYLKRLDFDGLSLPTRNLGPAGIALFLLKFYQMGVKRVHLLSVSNFTGLAVAAFFARHVFEWCSVDATTWRIMSQNQTYLMPNDLRQFRVASNTRIDPSLPITCDCPWCSTLTFSYLKNIPQTDRSSILRCHNYYVIEKAGRDFFQYADDPESFGWYLRTRNIKRDKKLDQLIYSLPIIYSQRDMDIRELEKLLWKFEK